MWPNVNWDDIDLFELTFDAFDAAGIAVGSRSSQRAAMRRC